MMASHMSLSSWVDPFYTSLHFYFYKEYLPSPSSSRFSPTSSSTHLFPPAYSCLPLSPHSPPLPRPLPLLVRSSQRGGGGEGGGKAEGARGNRSTFGRQAGRQDHTPLPSLLPRSPPLLAFTLTQWCPSSLSLCVCRHT